RRLVAQPAGLGEAAEGRQPAHGGGGAALVYATPPPPPPPAPLEPIEEPTWAPPDPWQRPAGANVPLSLWETTDGINIITDVAAGTLRAPVAALLDLKLQDIGPGRATATIPAREGVCDDSRRGSGRSGGAPAGLAGWGVRL